MKALKGADIIEKASGIFPGGFFCAGRWGGFWIAMTQFKGAIGVKSVTIRTKSATFIMFVRVVADKPRGLWLRRHNPEHFRLYR